MEEITDCIRADGEHHPTYLWNQLANGDCVPATLQRHIYSDITVVMLYIQPHGCYYSTVSMSGNASHTDFNCFGGVCKCLGNPSGGTLFTVITWLNYQRILLRPLPDYIRDIYIFVVQWFKRMQHNTNCNHYQPPSVVTVRPNHYYKWIPVMEQVME